jgi:hypothetical protein
MSVYIYICIHRYVYYGYGKQMMIVVWLSQKRKKNGETFNPFKMIQQRPPSSSTWHVNFEWIDDDIHPLSFSFSFFFYLSIIIVHYSLSVCIISLYRSLQLYSTLFIKCTILNGNIPSSIEVRKIIIN